ncbi:hypothetical protein CPB83DRAFT_900853 [Crepidotus variabilis]|uniref:Uncharacterized protein n=1 Tax=Crepidotus variabilis TaxID=179855 RepID=A0A9P6BC40_9AGAR|nr:hypothetical protein CPB83DRAFT_900853 [Crepidotus variabilis]
MNTTSHLALSNISARYPCAIPAGSVQAFDPDAWLREGTFVKVFAFAHQVVKHKHKLARHSPTASDPILETSIGLAVPYISSTLPVPPSGQRGQNFYRLSAEEKIVVLDGNGRLSKGGGLLFNVLHPAILDLPDLVPRMIIHAANRTAASTPPSFVEELRLGIDIAHWAYASHLEEHLGRLLSQCLTQRQLKALHSSETTVEQQVKRIAGCRPLVAALSETRLLTKKNAPWYEAEEQTIIFFHILERYRLYENAVAIVHAAAAQMSLLDGKISGLLLPGQPLTALEKADIEFVRSLDRKSEKTFVTVITRAVAEAAQTYPLPPLVSTSNISLSL